MEETTQAVQSQYDAVLSALYGGGGYEDGIKRAVVLFRFATPLWLALGAADKIVEARRLIVEAIDRQLAEEGVYLAGCRKNDKTRRTTEAIIDRLGELRGVIAP